MHRWLGGVGVMLLVALIHITFPLHIALTESICILCNAAQSLLLKMAVDESRCMPDRAMKGLRSTFEVDDFGLRNAFALLR